MENESGAATSNEQQLSAYNLDRASQSESYRKEESAASRLDRWKRNLLDLSLNNRLLNFKETRKTLRILCPDLAYLEDALADGQSFTVHPRPSELDDGSLPRDFNAHGLGIDDDILVELLREELKSHRLRADATDAEANSRLLEIYREARISLEESGANTLYLALGFLSWYESPNSEQQRLAPLILVPLEIERRSALEGFSVRQSDDDPMVNVTLLELFKHDFDLQVPNVDPLPQDEKGIHVQAILTAFREAIKDFDRWEVLENACIGHFSFTKFLMWRDLEVRTEEIQRNRIVAHLINNPHEQFEPDKDLPDLDTLDTNYKPDEIFCPLEADSSQLAAICAASEGKSFVLHGPPGTGKSQTIANMIAHVLANGKTVLFVSEKMAALNVVHQRLVNVGLGEFCLELHSNKSRKKDVIDQLGKALDDSSAESSEEWVRQANRVATLRNELNHYVRALHDVKETGESLFQSFSKLIGLRDVPHVHLGWSADKTVNRDLLDELREVARQLETVACEFGSPNESVWAPVQQEEYSSAWRDNVESALKQLRTKCGELREIARNVAPKLGFRSDSWSELELRTLNTISKVFLDCPTIPDAMITAADWDSLNASIAEWVAHGLKRDMLREQLYSKYSPKLLELDLDGLKKRLVDGERSRFLFRVYSRFIVKRSLRSVRLSEQQAEQSSMLQDIEAACMLREEEGYIEKIGDRAREFLGRFWQDGEANWAAIEQMRDATSKLHKVAMQIGGSDIERASTLRQQWSQFLNEAREQLYGDGPIYKLLQEYVDKAQEFASARNAVESLLALDLQLAWGNATEPDHLSAVDGRVAQWIKHLNELRSWCHLRQVRRRAIDLGLYALINAYDRGELPASQISKAFERSFYNWWVDKTIDRDPILRNFFSRDFERKIQEFRDADRRYTELTRREIKARLSARLPRRGPSINPSSEMGFLQRERQKQRRHMPIRKLFQKIPNLLPLLKPCLLMSPISVAQYLDPAHPPFDLVIFDEASQMPVWDAIGAIARGRELIVVGDEKQLPPTNFFNRVLDSDSEWLEEGEIQDLESILDECIAAGLPNMYLRWHYRSRHESLIAFSNFHYYENRLLTFPSPDRERHVSLRLVNGSYDRSKTCTNRAEAEAVVAEIVRRLRDPNLPKQSIGVVTFSISQQKLIEDMLDDERRKDPEIERYFNSQGSPNNEPIFVKNLENVQGDERDIILFSVCYGPDTSGRVSMNFGPLNHDGGERRLNVAITRARKEVIVFSTIRGDDIDLSRTCAKGVADLKSFLNYAERGVAVLAEQVSVKADAECESPFEQQVREVLQSRGYQVHSQVGCSGYRIDLAVVDPERPGRYLLGIECDGANYHRAKTARDRDCIREKVLRNLGWRLHRVWSSDWWKDRDREIDRIEQAIEEARQYALQHCEEPQTLFQFSGTDAQTTNAPATQFQNRSASIVAITCENMRLYEPYKADQIFGDLAAFYDSRADNTIRRIVESVVKREGPISLGLASKRVAAHWNISKIGSRVAERIAQIAERAQIVQKRCNDRIFLWPIEEDPSDYKLFRVPSEDESTRRDPDDLPPEEIANAALHILESQVSIPTAELITETARIFGFARTGKDVAHSMRLGINVLLKRGDAIERDGVIVRNY